MDLIIDSENKCFKVSVGGHSSVLYGFNQVYERVCLLAQYLARCGANFEVPYPTEMGTEAQFMQYQRLIEQAKDVRVPWLDQRAPYGLKKAMTAALMKSIRLKVHYGCSKTGQDHGDVDQGHLFLSDNEPVLRDDTSPEGRSISLAHVVKLVDLDNESIMYEHRTYKKPTLTIMESPAGYEVFALANEILDSRGIFETQALAQAYVDNLMR